MNLREINLAAQIRMLKLILATRKMALQMINLAQILVASQCSNQFFIDATDWDAIRIQIVSKAKQKQK